MSATDTPATPAHTHRGGTAYELLTAVSMTLGRGPAARAIADLAALNTEDRVVDVGCGPGTAVRLAARRTAGATGVDPAPVMLRLGRRITALRRARNVAFVQAGAEALPLPDASATVLWALSSVHHWNDLPAGLSEAHRVLAPQGRILIAERLAPPGARGHAAHGLTREQADQLTRDLRRAGFNDVHCDSATTRRRTLLVVQGTRPTAG
jgi:ubiquinone/menaquinone biosynthesis C-methylase UbiE